jgi:hypothetical protein
MTDPAAGRRVAVVVVHGVGETTPGYAVNELVDTIERQFPDEFKPQRHCEVHPMTGEPLYEGDDPDSFPATARSADLLKTGERVRFYELYWADRTRTLPGRLNAFLGGFRILFESHQFIHAMLPKDGKPLTRALRRLLLVAAMLLRGPIAALNICLFAVVMLIALVLYLARFLRDGSDPSAIPELQSGQMTAMIAAAMAAVAAGALFLFVRRWRRHNTEWNDVYVATFLGALFVAGFAWLLWAFPDVPWIAGRQELRSADQFCFYVNRLYYLSQGLWAVWGAVMLAALATLGVLALRRSPEQVGRPAAEAAIAVVATQSTLWIALISLLSLPMLQNTASYLRLPSCELYGLHLSFAAVMIWSVMVGGTAAVVYLMRWTLARSPKLSLERRAALTPRMLFGGPIVFAVVFGVVVGLLVFYVKLLDQFGQANQVLAFGSKLLSPEIRSAVKDSVDQYTPAFSTGTVALAVGVMSLMAWGFTNAIHIARDLIDHQYSPRLGYSYYLLPPGLRKLPHRPRRERLRARLDALSDQLVCEEGFDGVVFVVHSQGSVIAYDFLTSDTGTCQKLLAARPHLVTFGSPLGHLYQFYFKEYAALHADIRALRPKLASWVNLFRVDDYVGRDISDPDGFVQNIVMPAGGHIDYWKEKKLAEAVLERIRTPGGALAPAGGQTA